MIEERKKLKLQLDEKFNALRSKRSEFKERNDKYYNYIRQLREQRKEEQRKEDERLQKEYEKKLAEYEKEMEKIHPYQDEMDLCDALIKYLEMNFAKELNLNEVEGSTANGDCKSCHALDGMKPLERKQDDYIMMGGKGKKAGKKNKKGKQKLSLPIAQMDSYSTIGILPPSNVAALADSVKAIKERKEYYQVQTVRAEKDKVSAAPKKDSTQNGVKKPTANKKYSAETADFPSLGEATATASESWGPSATE